MRIVAAALLALAAQERAPSCDTPQVCEAECRKNQAASCATLGVFLLYTAHTAQRKGVALKAFERACAGDDVQGCEYAARMLADGSPRKDPQKARAHAERGCRLGSQQCCELAAVILAAAPAPREFRDGEPAACGKATDCAQKCDAGDAHACHLLGLYRAAGIQGAAADLPRSRGTLLRACTLGDAVACDSAAAFAPGDELARKLRLRACNLGLPAACTAVALRARACKLNASECR